MNAQLSFPAFDALVASTLFYFYGRAPWNKSLFWAYHKTKNSAKIIIAGSVSLTMISQFK